MSEHSHDANMLCPACRHTLTGHDPIALRYCTATRDSGLARGCICAGELARTTARSH